MKKYSKFMTLSFVALTFMSDAHATNIKVMSYNILNTYFTDVGNQSVPWAQRKDLVFELISSVDPDLIGFQEDSAIQIIDLETMYPSYGVIKSPLETINPDKGHRAIFYKTDKFNLIDNGSFHPLLNGQRWATWAKLEKLDTNVVFFIINAHWNGFSNPSGLLAHQEQAEKTQEIISMVTQGESIIFTGDLNSINTSDQAIEYLTNNKDTFSNLSYPTGFKKLNTPKEWNVDRSPLTPFTTTFTIDYILTSDDIKFFNPIKLQKFSLDFSYSASDHYAVVETIILPGETITITPIIFQILLDE